MKENLNYYYDFFVPLEKYFVLGSTELCWVMVDGQNLLMKGKLIYSYSCSCVKLVMVMILVFGYMRCC